MHAPPPEKHTGSALHTSVLANLQARGIDPSREAYLDEASKIARRRVDPMARPIPEAEQTAWQVRRARDNAVGQAAEDALKRSGEPMTRETYLAAHERAEETAKVRYRDDAGRTA